MLSLGIAPLASSRRVEVHARAARAGIEQARAEIAETSNQRDQRREVQHHRAGDAGGGALRA